MNIDEATSAAIKRSWANRGYNDGRFDRPKLTEQTVPTDCWAMYLARYRVGVRERQRAATIERGA